MKRTFCWFKMFVVLCLLTLTGCAGHHDAVVKSFAGDRQSVFEDVKTKEVPPGLAIVELSCAVKSNQSVFLWFHNKHTVPPYRVYLNIDGQTAVLETDPVFEDKPSNIENDPQRGAGWKYHFVKTIALAPGKHKIRIGLPVHGVTVEQEIVLSEGRNRITASPVYKKKILRPYRGQHFSAGVETLDLRIN